jgi:hypothetical protein
MEEFCVAAFLAERSAIEMHRWVNITLNT